MNGEEDKSEAGDLAGRLQKLRRCQMLDSLCVQAEVIGLSGKGDDLCKRIKNLW